MQLRARYTGRQSVPDNRAERHARTQGGSVNLQPSDRGKRPWASLLTGSKVNPSVPLFHAYKQNKVFSYHTLNIETQLNELRVYS